MFICCGLISASIHKNASAIIFKILPASIKRPEGATKKFGGGATFLKYTLVEHY